ncbi:MAG: hypothetical protein RR294_05750 [Bacilli bacterium]
MPRKGRNFELQYEWLYKLNPEKYYIESPAMLLDKTTGGKREVDILIQYDDENGFKRKVGIECRDRKKTEDSMWIEQLTTKRNDLELDYIIATTTKTFTKNAVKKAAAHGVIVEKAEMINSEMIDKISKDLIIDIYFLKFEFTRLNFVINNKVISYKELLKKLTFIELNEFTREINGEFYFSLDPHFVLDKMNFKQEDFYNNNPDNNMIFSNNIVFGNLKPEIIEKLGITIMSYEILCSPMKVTYPVNNQISVFTVSEKSNKKFKVHYGDEIEYFKCGYVDDGKIINELKLKERKYYRYIGMKMCINTIFPENYDMTMDIEKPELHKNLIGEISFEKIV